MYTYISKSEEDTKKLAQRIAKKINIGDTIVLTGDLGSGKTKFTEGFLSFWSLENNISSPTFTIVNEYSNSNLNIFHFDVYRLNSVDEFYAIGGEEYFDKGICIVEWGELIKDALPSEYIQITFSRDLENQDSRIITIETYGNKYKNLFIGEDFK